MTPRPAFGDPLIDVVIVNWNAGAQLRACIDSLLAFGAGTIATIIVVDNGSTDNSLDLIAGTPVTIDRTGENLGFGRACNRGAAQGSADYILFLNPDAAVFAGTLPEVVRLMAPPSAHEIGVCSVRLVDGSGLTARECARFPSWLAMIGQPLGLAGKLRWFPSVTMRDFDHLSDREVDHVLGAFYLVRRNLFAELNGFDEGFFVYYEDLDLSLRVRQAGFKIKYIANVSAYHKGGGTSENVKAHRLFYVWRSRIRYAFKHYRPWQVWLFIAATLFVEPVLRIVRALVSRSPAEIGHTLRGAGMLWRDLPAILARSRQP